jgi:hypothetical protein
VVFVSVIMVLSPLLIPLSRIVSCSADVCLTRMYGRMPSAVPRRSIHRASVSTVDSSQQKMSTDERDTRQRRSVRLRYPLSGRENTPGDAGIAPGQPPWARKYAWECRNRARPRARQRILRIITRVLGDLCATTEARRVYPLAQKLPRRATPDKPRRGRRLFPPRS